MMIIMTVVIILILIVIFFLRNSESFPSDIAEIAPGPCLAHLGGGKS